MSMPRSSTSIRASQRKCSLRGVEFVGHGYHQRALDGADEAAVIAQSLDRLEAFTGSRPRGWLGPGLRETFDTPDLLRAAGVDYVMDWVIDDLPCWMTTAYGPLLAAPYALELNDSVVYAVEKHATPELFPPRSRYARTLRTRGGVTTTRAHDRASSASHRRAAPDRVFRRRARRAAGPRRRRLP